MLMAVGSGTGNGIEDPINLQTFVTRLRTPCVDLDPIQDTQSTITFFRCSSVSSAILSRTIDGFLERRHSNIDAGLEEASCCQTAPPANFTTGSRYKMPPSNFQLQVY